MELCKGPGICVECSFKTDINADTGQKNTGQKNTGQKNAGQKNADEKTHNADEKTHNIDTLKRVLNALDAMVYVNTPETGEILFINDNMKRHYNLEDDCTGLLCYELFHDGKDGLCDFCPCHKLNKEPHKRIEWLERRPSTNRTYRNTDSYIEWYCGKLVQLQHSVDITEYIEAKEQAISSNNAKSRFLASVSHEIRTPMNVILGIAVEQIHNKKNKQDIKDAFTQVFKSGNMLVGIIDDLLDLSKIEANKVELSISEYSFADLINDVIQMNVIKIGDKPIDFSLRLDENIPSAFYGDEIRIKQILSNLLTNSIKYTDRGIVELSVSLDKTSTGSDPVLIFQVTDTGHGMTKEQILAIYEEYSRFNPDINSTTEGLGLGMGITRKLIQMMNGEIKIDSKPGVGTVVTVHIPQKCSDSTVIGKDISHSLQQFDYSDYKQPEETNISVEQMPYGKVLIVDDIRTNRTVAGKLVALYGIESDFAKSGVEAIEKISSGKVYDIIYMDYMMPDMDGIETVKNMRKLGYKAPIVALTASALLGQKKMFKEAGFDGFISKPIKLSDLDLSLKKYQTAVFMTLFLWTT